MQHNYWSDFSVTVLEFGHGGFLFVKGGRVPSPPRIYAIFQNDIWRTTIDRLKIQVTNNELKGSANAEGDWKAIEMEWTKNLKLFYEKMMTEMK